MKTPTISILIPTQGRPTLERALDSVAGQLLPGDEVLVVIDSHEMDRTDVRAICLRLVPYVVRIDQLRILAHDAGGHDWGHSQINQALTVATGDYIHANDDDDIYLPGSLAVMREAIVAHPGRVFLFRFRSYLGGTVFWLVPGLLERNTIGGHCLLQPRIAGKVGQMSAAYAGDFDWIVDTLARHDEPPVWVDHVICEQRPQAGTVAA